MSNLERENGLLRSLVFDLVQLINETYSAMDPEIKEMVEVRRLFEITNKITNNLKNHPKNDNGTTVQASRDSK